MKTCIFLALAAAIPLHAADLLPELAPHATKYQEELSTLSGQKAAAMTTAKQTYVNALDAAEKIATSSGEISVVASITREREAVARGVLPATFPNSLPKTLQGARKGCVDALARITADFAGRQQRIEANYLRALGNLQAKAAENSELAVQINAEKKRLLATATTPVPRESMEKYAGTWTIVIGGYRGTRKLRSDGSLVHEDGKVHRWTLDDKHLTLRYGSTLWEQYDLPTEKGKLNGRTQSGMKTSLIK